MMQVGIQAYLLWEKAGQPQGADFSNDARAALQRQLELGATIEHLEKSLRAPSPKEPEPVKAAPKDEPKHEKPKSTQQQTEVDPLFHPDLCHASKFTLLWQVVDLYYACFSSILAAFALVYS